MDNTNHGVIAERVLEKKEQKEIDKIKDKETVEEARERLAKEQEKRLEKSKSYGYKGIKK